MRYIILIIIIFLNCFSIFGQGKISKPQNSKNSKLQLSVSRPDGNINGYFYVDLGLPSGTKWAYCNIGAEEPQDYGDYFAWGDVNSRTKFSYDDSPLYKINIENISGTKYDVATIKWSENWQIPTNSDWEELINNCSKYPFIYNGIDGFIFVGKNNHSIFFPACGDGKSNAWKGIDGRYWTANADHKYDNSSRHTKDGFAKYVKIGTAWDKVTPLIEPESRGEGLCIRPVVK